MNNVRINLDGIKKLKNLFSSQTVASADVGIFSNRASEPHIFGVRMGDDITVGDVARFQEFGFHVDGKEVAPRSFLRMPLFGFSATKLLISQAADVFSQTWDADIANKIMGRGFKMIVLATFNNEGFGNWAPLTEKTLRKRRKRGNFDDDILVDTGQLMSAIEWRAHDGS